MRRTLVPSVLSWTIAIASFCYFAYAPEHPVFHMIAMIVGSTAFVVAVPLSLALFIPPELTVLALFIVSLGIVVLSQVLYLPLGS